MAGLRSSSGTPLLPHWKLALRPRFVGNVGSGHELCPPGTLMVSLPKGELAWNDAVTEPSRHAGLISVVKLHAPVCTSHTELLRGLSNSSEAGSGISTGIAGKAKGSAVTMKACTPLGAAGLHSTRSALSLE